VCSFWCGQVWPECATQDSDIRRLGDIEIDLVAVQKLLIFILAAFVSGIIALFVNQGALNAGYDPKTAFNYEIGSFIILLLIFYGLIFVKIRH